MKPYSNHQDVDDYLADFTKTGKEMLVDLINYSNARGMTTLLKPEHTFFSRPKKLDSDCDVNTAIRFTKVYGYTIPEGSEEIQYNRVDIDQVAKLNHFNYEIELDAENDYRYHSDLLPLFLLHAKIKLEKEDIVDSILALTKQPDGTYPDVTLTISEDSIAYIGKITFKVKPKQLNIDSVVKVRKYIPFMPPYRRGLS